MTFVYMIKNDTDKLYIGITDNLKDRLNYHNSGGGAKFTKKFGEFHFVFTEEYSSLKQARAREVQLKKWSRKKKEFLVDLHKKGFDTKVS